MDRRFELRKEAMLAECEVSPEMFRGVEERLVAFVQPFAQLLRQPAQREHAVDYVAGLMSDLKRKNVESIAYRHDQDRGPLQHFIGGAEWDHQPLMMELARQVGLELGEADGVLVLDPSAFSKKGDKSAGVARQWCGRHGKVDNCQVAVYMAYVSRQGQALVNVRLYLPWEWTTDLPRCREAGVPKEVCFQTRHEQALEMIAEQGHLLPHAWVAGDDEMGRPAHFRKDLNTQGERYLLAVPSNSLIHDLDATPPKGDGQRGVSKSPFQRADKWRNNLPPDAWTRVNVRDGEKGPLIVEVATRRVRAKLQKLVMDYEETLVIVRCLNAEGATKYDYYFSNAARGTPVAEFARVALAAHRIEEAIKRGKSETGLAHYEVRTWQGWHHHQVLSLMATWFLVLETRRGKKNHAGDDHAPDSREHRHAPQRRVPRRHRGDNYPEQPTPLEAQHTREILSLHST